MAELSADRNFKCNMNKRVSVVVTGVTSFIGCHLARYFASIGHEVIPTISKSAAHYEDAKLARINLVLALGIDVKVLDITSKGKVAEFIKVYKPTYWIHHAGWASDYHSFNYDLDRSYEVNVAPLGNLYECLKSAGCRGVLMTGSSAEYSDNLVAADESHMCEPSTPYGVSKLFQTLRAKQLSHQYHLPTRVARVFIPFGPMDAPTKLLPSVLSALKSNKSISLTDCTQARDFLFIDDLMAGYGRLLIDLSRNGLFDVFNLSSGKPTVLKDLLIAMADLSHADTSLLKFGDMPMRVGETQSSWGSNDKAKAILDWSPNSLRSSLITYLSSN